MNSWGDEESVLQELEAFLNIEDTEREPTMPSTIQKYHKIISSNNEGSIFDDNYELENGLQSGIGKQGGNLAQSQKDASLGLFIDDKVIRVESGRGRGIRTVFKPAHPSLPKVGLDSEDLIYQQLRKVNPTGYSNKITENSVRQIRDSKSPNNVSSPSKGNNPGKFTPSLIPSDCSAESSKSSSPARLYRKLSTKSSNSVYDDKNDNKSVLSMSESRSSISVFEYEDDNANAPSAAGPSCTTTALESSSIPLFGSVNGDTSSISSVLNPSAAPFTSKLFLEKDKENLNKPIPLSELLRPSREHRKRYIMQNQQLELCNDETERENEVASEKKIQEILRQDAEEVRKQKIIDLASRSPELSWRRRTPLDLGSQSTHLSWRRRNSPPRQSYTYRNGDRQFVNLNSTSDFPPLK